jgi:predicted porin
MKKQLIALSVCGAFCGLAHADGSSVTVYGIIDAGIMTQSHAGNVIVPGASGAPPTIQPGDRATGFVDGQMAPSIYGIKGSEDLGGGLKASFDLEGGFNSGNGVHNSQDNNNQIFGRQAWVALGADWGTVTAGLQVDPAFIAAIATDPRAMTDSLSSLGFWINATLNNGGGASNGQGLQGGIFDNNAVSYTYEGNGLYVGALYGIGGVAGASSNNAQYSIGASYTVQGFVVAAGYVEDKAASPNLPAVYTGPNSKIAHGGLGYSVGPWAVRAQYADFKYGYTDALFATIGNTPRDDVKVYGIGGDWKSGANTVNLSFYDAKDNGGGVNALGFQTVGTISGYPTGESSKEIALMDTYSLSKRTSVYAQVADVKVDQRAGDSAGFSSAYMTAAGGLMNSANTTTTFFGFGIQHSF